MYSMASVPAHKPNLVDACVRWNMGEVHNNSVPSITNWYYSCSPYATHVAAMRAVSAHGSHCSGVAAVAASSTRWQAQCARSTAARASLVASAVHSASPTARVSAWKSQLSSALCPAHRSTAERPGQPSRCETNVSLIKNANHAYNDTHQTKPVLILGTATAASCDVPGLGAESSGPRLGAQSSGPGLDAESSGPGLGAQSSEASHAEG